MSGTNKQSLAARVLRRIATISVTLAIIAGAVVAVGLGSSVLQSRAEAVAPPEAAEPVPVKVMPLTFVEGYTRMRHFIGQIEPVSQIDMAFELDGRMVERPVDEGQQVEAGQVIARLDVELLQADRKRLIAARDALAAQLDYADRQLERSAKLREQGFSSVAREDEARASRDALQNQIIETEASLSAVDIRLEKSVLRAPRAGQIGALFVDPGSTLASGQPVVTLIEQTTPRFRVGLPLTLDLSNLERAEVKVGGRNMPARLLHIRPDVDQVTRTRTAVFELETSETPVFGRSASLVLPVPVTVRGTWVPLDALKEGDGGLWTVMVVDGGTVQSAAVEVLHAEASRAFVTGSFQDGALLIQSGAHRVVPGQDVRVLGGES